MKRITLDRISKINNRVTLISNIITAVIASGYTIAILEAPSEDRMKSLIILAIPLLLILIVIIYSICYNINKILLIKYNKQQSHDIAKMENIFCNKNIETIQDTRDMKDEISLISSQYQKQ